MSLDDLDIRGLPVGHLPVIRACLDQLGVFAVLDEHLPQHPRAHASDAEWLAVLVLNILSGRVVPWRMDQRFEPVDLELLLGDGMQASWFHENRRGRALDHIARVGTDTLLSEIVVRYLNRQDVGPFSVHLDHASVSVYGAYDTDQQPTPAHGHSKDHRPDLKQLVYGLSLHGAVGIPLTMGVQSGNTSDNVANRDHLTKLVGLLPRPEEVTIVADYKLVDGETLGRLTHAGFHFVSLVPKTVLKDPQRYPGSSRGDIHRRIGPENHERTLGRALAELVLEGLILATRETRWRRYQLPPAEGHPLCPPVPCPISMTQDSYLVRTPI
jgi:transposase